jgi:hypothetical protein
MKSYVYHPDADAEYTAATENYRAISPGLGGRFYDEIEDMVMEIRLAPLRFRQYDPPARRNLARHFPYAVVFLDEPDYVWIVAVMHLHREPGYWKYRME